MTLQVCSPTATKKCTAQRSRLSSQKHYHVLEVWYFPRNIGSYFRKPFKPDPYIGSRLHARLLQMGVSQNQGYPFGGPYNKDYSILGSILGSPYFEKLPNRLQTDVGNHLGLPTLLSLNKPGFHSLIHLMPQNLYFCLGQRAPKPCRVLGRPSTLHKNPGIIPIYCTRRSSG